MDGALLYPSVSFKRRRLEYYQRLDAVRRDGDWEGWVSFFLDCPLPPSHPWRSPWRAVAIAWTRSYRNARVFCYQRGHDAATWSHTTFRTILTRGITWAATKR